jgi:hypothetical protein
VGYTPFSSFEPPIQWVPGIMRSGRESMVGETSNRPTIAGFEISTRATPGISASIQISWDRGKGWELNHSAVKGMNPSDAISSHFCTIPINWSPYGHQRCKNNSHKSQTSTFMGIIPIKWMLLILSPWDSPVVHCEIEVLVTVTVKMSFGMCHHVVWLEFTSIMGEPAASILRVEE